MSSVVDESGSGTEPVRRHAERLDGPAQAALAPERHPQDPPARSHEPTQSSAPGVDARAQREPAREADCGGARGQGRALGLLRGRGDGAARILGLRHDGVPIGRRRRSRFGRGSHDAPSSFSPGSSRCAPPGRRRARCPSRRSSWSGRTACSPCRRSWPRIGHRRSKVREAGIPRIFLRREWRFSTSPPAIPTAVAPTATAGPLTLLAAPLIVPTTPPFPVPFWLGREPLRLAAGFFRPLALLDREAVDRLLVAAFERLRDEALAALALALGLDLGFALDLGSAQSCWTWHVPCPVRSVKPAEWPFSLPLGRERAVCDDGYPSASRANRLQAFRPRRCGSEPLWVAPSRGTRSTTEGDRHDCDTDPGREAR